MNVPPDAYEGVVRVSGQEIADLSVEAVREHMLVNPYDGEIFAGTLRTNIDPSGTSRMVPEAVEASMLTDVVALHREGLDHGVRDRGANLSGGQRQTAVPGPRARRRTPTSWSCATRRRPSTRSPNSSSRATSRSCAGPHHRHDHQQPGPARRRRPCPRPRRRGRHRRGHPPASCSPRTRTTAWPWRGDAVWPSAQATS